MPPPWEVGVLGSARLTENDARWTQAHKLGILLAEEGFAIVIGGYGGLMAAVSRGAREMGGRVIGLPMQHWAGIEPNPWNVDLRWSGNYSTRINHILIGQYRHIRSHTLSFKSFYASDIHGSDMLWRKFINAAGFYGVDVLIMGGDLAGKAVVPIVRRGTSYYAPAVADERAFTEDQLPALERRIRDLGQYPYRTTEEELAAVQYDQRAIDALFLQIMRETLERWLHLAEERLRGKAVRLYVMLGNDDEPMLREVLARSPVVVDPEDRIVELGEGFQMLSCGFANPTPWHSPREMPEEELQRHLEHLAVQLQEPARSVFNLHVPPIQTPIDTAPVVDENLSPVIQGSSILMGPGGSKAVRTVIEQYQPLLALHGHIHESRGTVKIGKTVCINPGSAYGEGVLHGALFELDKRKGLKRYQLTSG